MSDIKFTVRPEGLSLMEVFERYQHSFPVLIQVTQGYHGDTDDDTYSTGHIMRIHAFRENSHTYETCLLAKSIVGGALAKTLLSVSIYLDIFVSMISGIEGRTESDYQKFLRNLNRSADRIHFGSSKRYDDRYSSESEDDYDYIQPQHNHTYRETHDRKPPIPRQLNVQEITDRFENKPKVLKPHPTSHNEKAPPLPKRMAAPKPPEHHHYVNTTLARAMVKPMEQACTPTSGSGSSSRPSAAEDVGSSTCFVTGLSINQLADRLESLNLGKYSQTFKDAQICGDLLIDLDETVLRDDFEMKRYEAIKLMKYARTGFVPK